MKQVKTDARINHVQTDKLIAALIAEKEMLLRELEAVNRSGTPTEGFTNDGDWIFFSKYRVLSVKRCLISWEFFLFIRFSSINTLSCGYVSRTCSVLPYYYVL